MRRWRLPEPGWSRPARWSRRVAVLAVAVLGGAIFAARTERIDVALSMAAVALAVALALAAIVLAAVGIANIWNRGERGVHPALFGLFVGLLLLLYPGYLAVLAFRTPQLTDISTDLADPPSFELLSKPRAEAGHPPGFPRRSAALQKAAYPGVATLVLDLGADEAFEIVRSQIEQHRWTIVQAIPPRPPTNEGRLEFTVRTPIMSFPNDIIIRIRDAQDKARVDMRAASRHGRHDFGVNAGLILVLLGEVRDRAAGK